MNRKFDNELTYSPEADSASAKVEFSEGKTKIALALTLAKFTKSGFGSHKETIDIKRSVSKDVSTWFQTGESAETCNFFGARLTACSIPCHA